MKLKILEKSITVSALIYIVFVHQLSFKLSKTALVDMRYVYFDVSCHYLYLETNRH